MDKFELRRLAIIAWESGMCYMAGRKPGEQDKYGFGRGNLELIEGGIEAVLEELKYKQTEEMLQEAGYDKSNHA